MKVLLLLVMVTAVVGPLCPKDTDIYPCVCRSEDIDGSVYLNLDCSDVTSNSLLERVFQADFPFTKFWNLTIAPIERKEYLTELTPNVFREVTFVNIFIDYTYIRKIHEEALSSSYETLLKLFVINSEIDSFPFATLSTFTFLRFLNLANNKLPFLPKVESNTLLSIDLSENTGLTFSHETFSGAPELEELYLNNMGLTTFPPDVFSSLMRLKIIDLSKNDLAGELGPGVIRVPNDAVEDLRLNDNHITQINPNAITGVNRGVKINFQNNDITSLDSNNWFPLLDQLNGLQTVDLRKNPLQCACDLLWLLQDTDMLAKVHDDSTCSDGTLMKDTDVNELLDIC